YLIYASQDEDGPYTLLAEVTDPGQTFYFHDDAGTADWYYYLESDFDCPGEPVLQSDTLDNLAPVPASLLSVSVDGNNVIITWTPSPSPEVVAYIVSREVEGIGTLPLDTVFNANSYTDTEASPNERVETYFVEAIDACGNKSLVAGPHRTILPAITAVDSCERTISLNWNAYEGWSEGVEEYTVFVTPENQVQQEAGIVSGGQTSFTYSGEVNDGQEYCFQVVANRSGDGTEAVSSTVCVDAMVIQAVNLFAAVNATVDDGTIQFDWLWNANAAIANYQIERQAAGGNSSVVEDVTPVPSPNMDNTFTDQTADPNSSSYRYQIAVTDECGVVTTSNTVSTIFLEADAFSGVNDLQWTPYENELAVVNNYKVFRLSSSGSPVNIGTFDANTLLAADKVDLGDPDQSQACYYVEAEVIVTVNDSIVRTVLSRSNTACAQQIARMYVPSAFSPNDDGRNDSFRPYLQFGTPAAYEMTIYDRWGGQVFQTTDFSEGWDGFSSDGERVPVGPYAFYIRIEQSDGTVLEESGEVALLR
ncbi:MAG TPA: gliding motility-associated C-terminal domain-containing protein, partial [Phaeodactylibacter sp.]|nr:gliding motility-associated C-terminal domain-containing protein [Phaeodactylibacter sp.]